MSMKFYLIKPLSKQLVKSTSLVGSMTLIIAEGQAESLSVTSLGQRPRYEWNNKLKLFP
jgi:hypothetical protein